VLCVSVEGNLILPAADINLDVPINGVVKITGKGKLEPETKFHNKKLQRKRVRFALFDGKEIYQKRQKKICIFQLKQVQLMKNFYCVLRRFCLDCLLRIG
jgi:hypothetical protein